MNNNPIYNTGSQEYERAMNKEYATPEHKRRERLMESKTVTSEQWYLLKQKDDKGRFLVHGHLLNPVAIIDCQKNQEIAKLIASAPELLEACKLALCELDGLGTNVSRDIYHRPAYLSLQQAINKAEGRE